MQRKFRGTHCKQSEDRARLGVFRKSMGQAKDQAIERLASGRRVKEAIMTAHVLWMNIPLMVVAFGLWVGVPLWLVLRHPERNPKENRAMPAYMRAQRETHKQRPALIRVSAYDAQRGLVSM
jgi:hypothetical protein